MAAFGSGKSGTHSQHTCFGGGKQVAHTVEKKLSQAARLSTALFPRHTVGSSLFDLGLGHMDVTLAVVEQGDRNGIHRNGVAIEVEDSEPDFQQFHIRLISWCRQRHNFECVSQRNRL